MLFVMQVYLHGVTKVVMKDVAPTPLSDQTCTYYLVLVCNSSVRYPALTLVELHLRFQSEA